MPAAIELVPSTRIVYSRAWGALSDADMFDHLAQISVLFKDGALDASWAQICDFTGVDSLFAVSTMGVRSMAERNPWPAGTIRAFIVTTDEQFGMARMYQMVGDPKTEGLSITRSVAEANAYVAGERARLGIAS